MKHAYLVVIVAVVLGIALAFCLPVAANAAAVPKFGGNFNITGYLEPELKGPYTWCFVFTTTGGVLGFPNSGTWTVPSYTSGWSGTWYQNGDEVILHGVAASTYIFSWKGRVLAPAKISGRQVEFFIDGSTDTAGTFFGTKVSACGTGSSSKTGDPAR